MINLSDSLKLFLQLSKVQSMLNRRFDRGLGGLGFNEFMILYHLSQAKDEKLRRIDLAEKVGLTASGITRILLPMEKIGLTKKEANPDDARISHVVLAPGGKRKLTEALEDAELLAGSLLRSSKTEQVELLSKLLSEISGTIV